MSIMPEASESKREKGSESLTDLVKLPIYMYWHCREKNESKPQLQWNSGPKSSISEPAPPPLRSRI